MNLDESEGFLNDTEKLCNELSKWSESWKNLSDAKNDVAGFLCIMEGKIKEEVENQAVFVIDRS